MASTPSRLAVGKGLSGKRISSGSHSEEGVVFLLCGGYITESESQAGALGYSRVVKLLPSILCEAPGVIPYRKEESNEQG